MKFKYPITISVITLLLTGCLPADQSIDKAWFFTYYTGPVADRDSALNPASFINLQKDGNYTSDFGVFEYGTWHFKNKTLYLRSSNSRTTSMKVEYLSQNEMRISSEHFPSASFESQSSKFKSTSENPFSKENNLWRIHAAQNENDEEIKNRLLNHMKFWETYFSWALISDIGSIDVRSTPTPIKIYGNGFALKPFSELPQIWKSYFYDEADCRKANDMIRSVFDKHDIAWAHTDNKYKLFISAFQQLEQQFK